MKDALRLDYLRANQAFAFLFGDALLRLDGEPLFFSTRPDAIEAASRHGLIVWANGSLSSRANESGSPVTR